MARLTRRTLLASAAGGGIAAAAGGGFVLGREGGSEPAAAADQTVAFHGRHQAGIATPAQDRLHFAAFDVEEGLRADDLRGLLREWSRAAERMTAGRPVGDANQEALAPPQDTGEARGLTPAHLTVTFGLGPSLFDGRFGLAGPLYIRPGAGLIVHTGPGHRYDLVRNQETDLGSRVLFEPELGIGFQLSDRASFDASWVHMSHAQLFSRQNPGIDNLGVRLNFRL